MKMLNGVVRAQQFDKATVEKIFAIAKEMENNVPPDLLNGKIMASLFYEPSTRTRFSFELAMLKLGGKVVSTENAREFSSAAKGETLEDSIRTINQYGVDVIVLRYNKKGGAKRAQKFSKAPIINAGDGPGQHPTQALLDLYTIKKHQGKLEGLNIALVGDLANGRTVRSLCYFLAKHYPSNVVYLVSPEQTKMKSDIKNYMDKYGLAWNETDNLEFILPRLDIIYQTRVQKERFNKNTTLYDQALEATDKLAITDESLKQMKETVGIMHPLPRNDEIRYSVDKNPRAIYFAQVHNGLFIRMALLKMILVGY